LFPAALKNIVDTLHIPLVEATCKPFYEVIYYLAVIFHYAVHCIFASFKMMFNTRMKTEIIYWNLHAANEEQLPAAIMCTNVVDIILKNFNQIVDTLMKGYASGLH
jgi:hypothetical protein